MVGDLCNTQMVMDSLLSARIFDSMRLRIDTQRESTMECDRVRERERLCVCVMALQVYAFEHTENNSDIIK